MPVTSTTAHLRPDLVVYSYPKTGRTWLRFLLASYVSLAFHNDRPVTLQNAYDLVPNWDTNVHGRGMVSYSPFPGIPLVAMSHTPPTSAEDFKKALLIRDPRDTLVSHWHHANHHYENNPLSLEAFITMSGPDRIYGLALAVLANSTDPLHILSYEEMHSSASTVLSDLLRYAGLEVNPEAVETSVERSSFSRMQVVEATYGMKNITYDATNPLARRVRRGIIGSHRDELPTWAQDVVRKVHSAQPPWLQDIYEQRTGIGLQH